MFMRSDFFRPTPTMCWSSDRQDTWYSDTGVDLVKTRDKGASESFLENPLQNCISHSGSEGSCLVMNPNDIVLEKKNISGKIILY